MTPSAPEKKDEGVEQAMGNLLRNGVILAGAVILFGGVLFLVQHGSEPADRHTFRGEPAQLREPGGIVAEALALRGRGVIQLGLLLLIATPVARVGFAAYSFGRQRDFLYVSLTLFVLALLLYSLFAAAL